MPATSLHEDFARRDEGRGSSDRSFGLVFAVFLSAIGLLPLRQHQPPRVWALAAGAAFLAVAVLRPAWLAPLNRVWTKLGLLLGRIVAPVVGALLFYLVVTPTALLLRFVGKDPLRLALDNAAPSYWIERQPPGPAPQSMGNQF